MDIPDEKWGYVTVRDKAHMFWWLYGAKDKATRAQLPLILWLQGGPGGSGTGYGNFEEIGPLDRNLQPRDTTWITKANVLFIDNPVGAGFSYVDEMSALTRNNSQIAEDLYVIFSSFLQQIPALRHVPFYIFCESYGGKMTAGFGERLYQGILANDIDCDFRGVALGDSWISGIDSVLAWGPYLYSFNLLDGKDLGQLTRMAELTQTAVEQGRWLTATQLWGKTEQFLMKVTDQVSFYNVLKHHFSIQSNAANHSSDDSTNVLDALYERHAGVYNQVPLSHLMDTKIRAKLKIIPRHVRWSAQASQVFRAQSSDFMRPVTGIVDKLLAYGLKVAVFQGQLDLICCTPGAERWISKLNWPKLKNYQAVSRIPLYTSREGRDTQAFVKAFENFSVYYIMNAGHMVPADNGPMALKMMSMIIS